MTVADDAEEGHRSVPAPGPNSLARCVCWERPLPIDVEMHTTAPPSALLRDARQFNLRGGWDVEHGDAACGVKATYIANTEFEYTARTGQPRSGARYASLPWQTGMPIAIQMKLSGCVRTCEAGIMSP